MRDSVIDVTRARHAAAVFGRRWRGALSDPRRAAGILWWAPAVVLVWGLSFTPTDVGDSLGLRRFRTPEVVGDISIAQQFVMNEKNLKTIEIRPVSVGSVGGALRLTLTDLRSQQVIRTADVAANDLLARDVFAFDFEPVADSWDRPFELTLTSSPGNPASGIAFWATKGERLENARLLVNGVARWADLAFQTRTPVTASVAARVTAASGWQRVGRLLVLAGFVLLCALLRVVLRTAVALPEPLSSPHPTA